MPRFKCICSYDGTDFCGWQSQPNGLSVQDFIEKRLFAIFKKPIRIHASGRTDAGVHANAQVFHFDADWPHSVEQLLIAMRSHHRRDVLILSLKKCSPKFHARFSVIKKRYVYKIYEGFAMPETTRYVWSLKRQTVDFEKMKDAAEIFLGTHNFRAYSANRGKGVVENTVKTIYELNLKKRGKTITISTLGSGYLYKMVRMLVGALVQVGLGKLTTQDLQRILLAEIRGTKIRAAPAEGLRLDKVFYK